MNPETEPIQRPANRQQVADLFHVLTQVQRSGSIHFLKSLPETAVQASSDGQAAELSLPAEFVQENDQKIEEWVILRGRLSSGRASRPWLVRLSFIMRPNEAVAVQIAGGWPAFVADNRLKEGDSLIFLLKEDARSEFEVFMFRGPWGSPYFPDEGERSDSEDEESGSEYFPNERERSDPEEEEEEEEEEEDDDDEYTNNQTRPHSPVHQEEEHHQAFIREGNPAQLQHDTENPRVHPSFSKRLSAYNIGRSDGLLNSGQFEFPRDFLRNHGRQVCDSVKLQGIHENSRNYVISCRRRPGDSLKVYCNTGGWSRFVQANDLKEGNELQFSLVAKSSFVVRKIS